MRTGDDGWEGPVFLPGNQSHAEGSRYWFYAKLNGRTQTYAFLPTVDSMAISTQEIEIFRTLVESGFAPEEWAIRADAAHAKSKTYKMSGLRDRLRQTESE